MAQKAPGWIKLYFYVNTNKFNRLLARKLSELAKYHTMYQIQARNGILLFNQYTESDSNVL